MQSEGLSQFDSRGNRKRRRACTRNKFVGPAAKRVEFPTRKPVGSGNAPDIASSVLQPAVIGVRYTIRIADTILIESDRVHALGKKPTAIWINQPEHAVPLIDAKKAACLEATIRNATPPRVQQAKPRPRYYVIAMNCMAQCKALDLRQHEGSVR
jgi:hypothetical protein